MNGFFRLLGKGGIALACVGLASGCNTTSLFTSSDDTDAGASCSAKGSCGKKKCFDGHCDAGGKHGSGEKHKFIRQIENYDYEQLHPDHCWPEQYSREAMRRVNAPFHQQMLNGNDVELTVWEHYFVADESGKPSDILNEAGKRRLQYFARRKPYVIPALQLQTSFDPNLDAKRVQSIVAAANKVSMSPQPWTVTMVDRAPTGLFGPEGPKAITKMIGPGAGPPAYERNIKAGFLAGPNTGSLSTGS